MKISKLTKITITAAILLTILSWIGLIIFKRTFVYEGKGPQDNLVCSQWEESYACDFTKMIKNKISWLPFYVPLIVLVTIPGTLIVYIITRRKLKN